MHKARYLWGGALILALSMAGVIPAQCLAEQYKVVRVVEGDIIRAAKENRELVVRLVGIDAPDYSRKKYHPAQPFSSESAKHLAEMVLDKLVEVRIYGFDRNGMAVAEVFVNGMNVNQEMIKAGLAEVYRGRPAIGLDLAPYWQAENQARAAGRGMWSLGDKYLSPTKWRHLQGG